MARVSAILRARRPLISRVREVHTYVVRTYAYTRADYVAVDANVSI